jgi:CheY-like chemotaxis protein
MEDLRTELSPLAERKGLTIKFMPCAAMVSSDKTLLRSILQNLIGNAIRYTSTGKVLIGCRAEGKNLKIQVYDTGTGISKENLPYIFDEFHRIQNPADNEKQGLGLGLAITKRLAEMLEHPLKVQSQIDRGSQFSITLPRYFGALRALPKRQTWQPAGNLSGITVLYLENSVDSLEAMAALLNNWGCEVIKCATFEKAVDAFRQNTQSIDMVLADYRLDESQTGLDFLNFAREFSENIIGVLVTAEQDLSIKNNAQENGHIFLAKPVEPAALRGILTRLASISRQPGNTGQA